MFAGFEGGEPREQWRSGFEVRTREKVAVQQHCDNTAVLRIPGTIANRDRGR